VAEIALEKNHVETAASAVTERSEAQLFFHPALAQKQKAAFPPPAVGTPIPHSLSCERA